ncbi:hypothetical protein JYT36_00975 [Bacteroidales bacterium AH-315-N07]|nr:hypothetical protein [Bacteroidales bacterium AH-315-N07]
MKKTICLVLILVSFKASALNKELFEINSIEFYNAFSELKQIEKNVLSVPDNYENNFQDYENLVFYKNNSFGVASETVKAKCVKFDIVNAAFGFVCCCAGVAIVYFSSKERKAIPRQCDGPLVSTIYGCIASNIVQAFWYALSAAGP